MLDAPRPATRDDRSEAGDAPPRWQWTQSGRDWLGAGRATLHIDTDARNEELRLLDRAGLSWRPLAEAIDAFWSGRPELQTLHLAADVVDGLDMPEGWLDREQRLHRSHFYQEPELWYHGNNAGRHPLQWTERDDGLRHPLRKPFPRGTLYRRYLPQLECWLSFRRLDIDEDLDRFTRWMNDPRIAPIWELAQARDALADYLRKVLDDAHLQPVIACFDDRPFGYFEMYWAMEDRLGPYYEPQAHDRGAHLLVGDPAFLGRRYTLAWISGFSHFLFLDDHRTQRLVGEPRADNARLLSYLRSTSWTKLGEFDFPHKRAALLMCERERFFRESAFS